MRGLQHERLGTGVNLVGAGEEVICYKCSLPVHVGEKIFIILWYIHSQKLISYGTFPTFSAFLTFLSSLIVFI